MCGITGFIDKRIKNKDMVIRDMADLIKHRKTSERKQKIDHHPCLFN